MLSSRFFRQPLAKRTMIEKQPRVEIIEQIDQQPGIPLVNGKTLSPAAHFFILAFTSLPLSALSGNLFAISKVKKMADRCEHFPKTLFRRDIAYRFWRRVLGDWTRPS